MKKLTTRKHVVFPTRDEISTFEILNNIKLPDVFRYFLMTQNPSVVEEQTLKTNTEEFLVFAFIPFSLDDSSSFQKVYTKTKPIFKGAYLPFASNAFGQLFLIGTDTTNFGSIFLWQKESDTPDDIKFVSEDITAFVNALR